jgi:uncharacterized protein involved in exopolysaccharide biosynthesis
MKHLIRFLASLYPASWRERYGAEFAALLEDTNPNWRTSLDVLKGALRMQMQIWNLAKMLVLTSVAGALVALVGSFAVPKRYVSQTVLKAGPNSKFANPTSQLTLDYMNELEQRVLSRTALTRTIMNYRLYQHERSKMPLEDVIEFMRKSVSILPLRPLVNGATPAAVAMQFVYEDPATAQQVTQDLAAQFIDQNIRDDAQSGPILLEILDPASLPSNPFSPRRPLITTAGLAAGLAVGAVMAWFRRSRKPA